MEKKKWFEEWFDSPYYPILYQNRNYLEASNFIERLIQEFKEHNPKEILDLACGEGRHSIHLNKKGFHVTGIDLSKRSIDLAKRSTKEDLHFEIQDMRTFELKKKFDVILNLFTSFGYFQNLQDNAKVLQSVHKHLNDDGLFILDFFNANKVENELKAFEIKMLNSVLYLIQKKIEDGKVVKKISIYDQENKWTYYEKVQLIHEETFKTLFTEAGFKIINTYGSYSLTPFDPNKSERLIIFAKK